MAESLEGSANEGALTTGSHTTIVAGFADSSLTIAAGMKHSAEPDESTGAF